MTPRTLAVLVRGSPALDPGFNRPAYRGTCKAPRRGRVPCTPSSSCTSSRCEWARWLPPRWLSGARDTSAHGVGGGGGGRRSRRFELERRDIGILAQSLSWTPQSQFPPQVTPAHDAASRRALFTNATKMSSIDAGACSGRNSLKD